jgi:hypothetical protein
VGRSAFISRREGRYLFRARWPACLAKNSTSAFRISLRTADYKVAATRAARIGSWMLNVKAADDPEAALKALWPRLQALAVEPARDEADRVERSAFQLVAFEAQYLVRGLGLKPNTVVPGWDEHFVALVRENSKAANTRAAAATIERAVGAAPTGAFCSRARSCGASAGAAFTARPWKRRCLRSRRKGGQAQSVVRRARALPEFAGRRRYGDRSATNDIAPIVQFAVDLWQDPCLHEVGPDQIVQLKQAMPEIPTTEGPPADKRSLFQRWSIAKQCNYVLVDSEGKNIKLTRVSESTLRKRYRTGLNTSGSF